MPITHEVVVSAVIMMPLTLVLVLAWIWRGALRKPWLFVLIGIIALYILLALLATLPDRLGAFMAAALLIAIAVAAVGFLLLWSLKRWLAKE